MRISKLKDILITFGPALLLIAAAFWVAFKFVKPAPPSTISICTGPEDGAYFKHAHAYKNVLAENKITLNIKRTEGSIENIKRIKQQDCDAAFVQSGTGSIQLGQKDGQEGVDKNTGLISLGSLYYEPLWVFHTKSELARLSDLKHRRISVGTAGSGTRPIAMALLADNGLDPTSTKFIGLGSKEAAIALQHGKIDAAIFVASHEFTGVQALLRKDAVRLMNFHRAEAYLRKHLFLSKITLPEGAIDMATNIPSENITLLAPTVNLVVHEDFHSSLIVLLLQAAQKIHGQAQLFEKAGEFPSAKYLEYPLSDTAQRFYKSGPPFLQRYLPFWLASLIDQMWVMILPLLALALPLAKILPPLYRWRIRSRIYSWYEELRGVERKAKSGKRQNFPELYDELERIEDEVEKVEVPLSYEDQHYNLRLHINCIRDKLRQLESNQAEKAHAPS